LCWVWHEIQECRGRLNIPSAKSCTHVQQQDLLGDPSPQKECPNFCEA
jgi:hypothetical protein